ncbi:hypothetical protein JCM8547_007124 [Rhodosporidiobolus lusitaniae]
MNTLKYEHTFVWEGQAENAVVTGSFDDAELTYSGQRSSVILVRTSATSFAADVRLPFGERVVYKFVVDGVWRTSCLAPVEWDSQGNENNVLIVPSLVVPPIHDSHCAQLQQQAEQARLEEWRTVRLARWKSEGELELFAALQPSWQLTFRALRQSVVPSLLELPQNAAYRLASLEGVVVDDLEEKFEEVEEEPVLPFTRKILPTAESTPSGGLHLSLPAEPFSSSASSSSASLDNSPTPSSLTPSGGGNLSSLHSLSTLTPSLSAPQTENASGLSRMPRSATRYFDFSDSSWSSSLSTGGLDGGSEYSFADGESSVSRSASRRALSQDGGEEDEEEEDAKSDVTFNTALSGWVSDVGAAAERVGEVTNGNEGDFEGEGEGEGWSSSALGGVSSESEAEGRRGQEKDEGEKVYEATERKEEVERAWEEGKWVFLETPNEPSPFTPLALHPSALPLLPLIHPSAALLSPSSSTTPFPSAAIPPDTQNDAKKEEQGQGTYLLTPPASPPSGSRFLEVMDLDARAVQPASSSPSKQDLFEAVKEQREGALGRWVAVA